MYDRFVNVASLVDETLFLFFYNEAATETALLEQYRYDLDPEALKLAGSKFVFDFLQLDNDQMEALSWEKQVSVVINLLVRATAAFPIVQYLGPKLIERSRNGQLIYIEAFNSRLVREKTTSLVSLTFAAKILSMEMSNFFHEQGWFSANIDALREIKTQDKARYVAIIEQDAKRNFATTRKIRRDFRVTWAIKALLKKHLIVRQQ